MPPLTRAVVWLLIILAVPLPAERYWIAYERSDFPENEGWVRTFGDGALPASVQTDRKIETGAVVGDMSIESFCGDLAFVSLVGNITTGTGLGERTPGDILIRSKYIATNCSFMT